MVYTLQFYVQLHALRWVILRWIVLQNEHGLIANKWSIRSSVWKYYYSVVLVTFPSLSCSAEGELRVLYNTNKVKVDIYSEDLPGMTTNY